MSYEKAGVSIGKGESLIRMITPSIRKTYVKSVLEDIGGFSAFFQLPLTKYKKPVLLATTDGVGTKVMVAISARKYDGIGIDLVAMCVNDLIVHGGKPLFFLDYYATSRLETEVASQVIKSIARGCVQSDCALIGGETAEMPSMYKMGDFDIAGFCVGIAERHKLITGKNIRDGDILIGLPSSGFHSNGFSLVRKVLFQEHKFHLEDIYPGTRRSISRVLLTPTKIYVRPLLNLMEFVKVKGMSHITGGGLYGNVGRIIPDGFKAIIESSQWSVPTIFDVLQDLGNIERDEMYRTFNMGIGLVLVVSRRNVKKTMSNIENQGLKGHVIGRVEKRRRRQKTVELVY